MQTKILRVKFGSYLLIAFIEFAHILFFFYVYSTFGMKSYNYNIFYHCNYKTLITLTSKESENGNYEFRLIISIILRVLHSSYHTSRWKNTDNEDTM